MNTASHGRQRGLTLIECCIGLAVTAISVGIAAPNFGRIAERHRVEGVAAQLETDIQFARSLAVAHHRPLRISFGPTAGVSACYLIHTGGANDCQCDALGQAVCSNGAEVLRSVPMPSDSGVALRANARSILLDADRGTVTPTATMAVAGRSGATLNVVVNIMGRVRSCNPGPEFAGHPHC